MQLPCGWNGRRTQAGWIVSDELLFCAAQEFERLKGALVQAGWL